MKTYRALVLSMLAIVCSFLAGMIPAHADIIATVTVTTAPVANGRTAYQYTIFNDPSSTENVGAFYLGVPDDANLMNITMPADWGNIYTIGYPIIEFYSPESATDIHPGDTGLFSFDSALDSGTLDYALQSYDYPYSMPSGSTLGPSDTPTITPEPDSLLLLGTALPLIAAAAHKRFRKDC